MDRREMLGLVGAGTAGLMFAGGREARADHEHHHHDEHIRTLGECAKLCNEAAHHCLGELSKGSSKAEMHAKSHEMTMDCQAFCTLSAALMARSSTLAVHASRACAEACKCCAEACAMHDDEIMKACAEKCRECEKLCRAMVESGASSESEKRRG
jgi:hypothetical protein